MNAIEDLPLLYKEIHKRIHRLDEYEQNALANFEELTLKGKPLSFRQDAFLDKLYEKATENG